MKVPQLILFMPILVLSFATMCKAGYKDWSRHGPEFQVLEPLLFNARDVKYIGPTSLDLYGVKMEASRFEVIADIIVQTHESPVSSGSEWGKAGAKYELIVAKDLAFEIHDRMLEEIRTYWLSKSSNYLKSYKTLPAEKSIFYKDGAYVLYKSCINSTEDPYDTLWLDNKVVRGRFVAFVKGAGLGGPQNLMEEVLRYRVKGHTIPSNYKSDFPPDKFLDLYDKGAFNHN